MGAAGIAAAYRDAGVEAGVGGVDATPTVAPDGPTVEVEWVGEPSFLSDPVVEYRLLRTGKPGGYTPAQAAAIRAASRIAIRRTPGHARIMGERGQDGLSRRYAWGPGAYVQRMTYADAERLKATSSGHEFRILGHEPEAGALAAPQGFVRLVNEREFDGIDRYVSARAGA